MLFRWWRRRTGEQIAERMNRDYDKEKWLQKILSKEEFTDFNLAGSVCIFYERIIEKWEPKWSRSREMRRFIREFHREVKGIIKQNQMNHLSERDQQVVELMVKADFEEDTRCLIGMYLYFRKVDYEEKVQWDQRMKLLRKEFFGVDR